MHRNTGGFCLHIPLMGYPEAQALQNRCVDARRDGRLDTDLLMLLEHPAVFTLGRNGGRENLTVSDAFLAGRGVEVAQAERGGNITYHGPGQLVGYPILDLEARRISVREYVTGLETVLKEAAAEWGVAAGPSPVNPGLWVGEAKLASIGLCLRHGVAFHGFALNVANDLTPFSWIHPCGLKGVRMTSMARELGVALDMADIREAVERAFSRVFHIRFTRLDLDGLNRRLSHRAEASAPAEARPSLRKPPWLRRRMPSGPAFGDVRRLIEAGRLHTVCQEARCPNQWECFSRRTATFLIMGPRCTRACRFCAVEHGPTGPPDPEEPRRVAEAARAMGLAHVVVTSVTRDDLPDGGASFFVDTIRAVRHDLPKAGIEVLVPDFQGRAASVRSVAAAGPDVFNHNLETVPRLYPTVRPGADYRRSLSLFGIVREVAPRVVTKSGLMLGLGETQAEVQAVLEDLLEAGCRTLTLGQYLQPTPDHLPVVDFLTPEAFERWGEKARSMGFAEAASGPLVRSSYQAGELFQACRCAE